MSFPKICGVLVEPRRLLNTDILIENYTNVMVGRILFFFCGSSSYSYYKERYSNNPLVKILDLGVDNLTAFEHNDLWKSLEFWDIFEGYTHVLTIQTDGCLCEDSEYKIENFFEYDYIGGYTPNKWWWKETQGLHKYSDYQCFNGGFSFRKISAMKEVLRRFPPSETKDYHPDLPFTTYGEDLYYVVGLLRMTLDGKQLYKVGLDEYATNFCTHTHYTKKTFCVHKLDNYVNEERLSEFLKYCPLFINFIANK